MKKYSVDSVMKLPKKIDFTGFGLHRDLPPEL